MAELDLTRAVTLAREAMYPDYVQINSCIAMSRFMIEVLNHFGYPAQANRASAVVYNRKMAELINSDKLDVRKPMPQWAEDAGAWNVGVGKGDEGLHVVVLAGDYMLDASLDQASRPEHDIVLEPSVFPYKPGLDPLVYQDDSGLVLTYKITGDTESFTRSPDWRLFKKRYAMPVAKVIRQLRMEMK